MKKLLIMLMVVVLLVGCNTTNEPNENPDDPTQTPQNPGEEEELIEKSSYDILVELYKVANIELKHDLRLWSNNEEAISEICFVLEIEGEIVGFINAVQTFPVDGPNKVFIMELETNEDAIAISDKLSLLSKGYDKDIEDYEIVVKNNFVLFAGLTAEENESLVQAFDTIDLESSVSAKLENSLDVFNAIFRDADAEKLQMLSYLTDKEEHIQKVNNYINKSEELEGYMNAVMNTRMMGPSIVFIIEMEEGSDIEETKSKVEDLKRWMICMEVSEYEVADNGNYILFAGLSKEENTSLVENFKALELK